MIRPASAEDLKNVREMFLEYAAWVSDEICFESFERELAGLPGAYGPPGGELLVAIVDGQFAGCAAFRNLGSGVAEMKRLYVRPAYRGDGLGRKLTLRVAEGARMFGYKLLRLDTLQRMNCAIGLYQALGFREIPPYGGNPAGALCFELELGTGSG
jgi:putative acetyltransferase